MKAKPMIPLMVGLSQTKSRPNLVHRVPQEIEEHDFDLDSSD
jgi:hypothetical protein